MEINAYLGVEVKWLPNKRQKNRSFVFNLTATVTEGILLNISDIFKFRNLEIKTIATYKRLTSRNYRW